MQGNFSEKADIGRKKLKFKEKERPEEKKHMIKRKGFYS